MPRRKSEEVPRVGNPGVGIEDRHTAERHQRLSQIDGDRRLPGRIVATRDDEEARPARPRAPLHHAAALGRRIRSARTGFDPGTVNRQSGPVARGLAIRVVVDDVVLAVAYDETFLTGKVGYASAAGVVS